MNKRRMIIYGVVTVSIVFLTVIAAVIYYRSLAGNMVFSIDPNAVSLPSIEIADNIEFEPSSTRLEVDSKLDQAGITYSSIKLEEVLESEGQYVDLDQKYLAYSFYLKNTGMDTVSVAYYMRLTEVTNELDDYVRILIIEGDGNSLMYQKEDQPNLDEQMPSYNQLPIGINFETERRVFSYLFHDFRPGDIKSYRVIIWLEEQDPDINDNHQSGSLKAELVFSIEREYRTESNQSRLLSSENEELWFTLAQICNVEIEVYYGD